MNTLTEYNNVEKPLMEQLRAMGWEIELNHPQHRDVIDLPHLTHRENFDQVLLLKHVKAALYKLNVGDNGMQWLDEARVESAIIELQRVGRPRLMESNVTATKLLLEGVTVKGDPALHGGRNVKIQFIDFKHPERNHYLAINQFRVNTPTNVSDAKKRVPDIVLFVNGIPLVVIECKAPQVTEAMNQGIEQLLQYTNQRGSEQPEGIESLFWYNQALISTYYNGARVSTIGASYEHYLEWKTTAPRSEEQVIQEVQTSPLMKQHKLVAGILRPSHLIDIVRHFTLFKVDEGRTIKVIARYQQWQAVQEAIRRLREEPTRLLDGEFDRRGGIIWHTQGSGKSLSMVFLVRKLRTLADLRQFKVVVVTDRRDLEEQLSETMQLTGETVQRAENSTVLKRLLQENAPGLIFGMIQKYRRDILKEREVDNSDLEEDEDSDRIIEDADRYEPLNTSTNILLLVDEAHRSHTDEWHANLLAALPNCARIGFTGTPIFAKAKQKSTNEIFGTFIDIYNIKQAEEDGVIVPIFYEGREVKADVLEHSNLDQLFEKNFEKLTPNQREKIKEKYAREKEVLESIDLIRTKAEDILKHYISTVLPNGFKAQLIAVSRLATIRYQQALAEAHERLLRHLERMDASLAELPEDKIREYDGDTQYYIGALKYLDTIRQLEFASVISSDQHDTPDYRQWSDKNAVDARIQRFKKPLNHEDAGRRDGLAFLCVRTMLLTGFDAPVEQVIYLDRFIQGHELLQAIARVNRKYKNKQCGYVVDYYGVTNHLATALAVYSQSDVEGTMQSIHEELPKLQDRFNQLKTFFRENGVDNTDVMNDCILLLVESERARAEFTKYFKAFLVKLDIILPRPEALTYVDEAKYFGVISRTVTNMLREEEELALAGVGDKVRKLIDDHLRAYHIEQTVPPLSIMDANYEKQVERQTSDRAKAAEMEHAARYEITVKMDEDPIRYEKLSERLENILDELGEHWYQLVEALKVFIVEMRSETATNHTADFFPERDSYRFKPFMSILLDSGNVDIHQMSNDNLKEYAGITVGMIKIIRNQISLKDFWSTPQMIETLKSQVKVYLDNYDIVEYDKLDTCADKIVQLAKRRHMDLINA